MSGNGGWANPLPAGLVGLSVALMCFYAMFMGYINKPGCLPLVGFWLLGCFIVQFVAAMIELREGTLVGGNVFLIFSAFFCFVSGISMLFKYFAALNGWPVDPKVDGFVWVILLVALVPITFSYLKKSPLVVGLAVISITIAIFFLTLIDLGILSAAVYGRFVAYGSLGGFVLCMYTVSALFLNSSFEKTILPMPGPMIK